MATKKARIGILLLGVVAFAFSFATTAWAGLKQDPPPVRIHLSTDRFDQWQYDAYREGDQLTLQVNLDDTSQTGLVAFRTANQRLADQLLPTQSTLSANIVLNTPISPEDFERLVAKYGLQVTAFQMRAIDGRGDRVTLFGSPSSPSELVSLPVMESMLAWSRKETGDATLLGVTSIEASIPTLSFSELSASPGIYLIDVTPSIVKEHFEQSHAGLIRAGDAIVVPVYPLYWYLEDRR